MYTHIYIFSMERQREKLKSIKQEYVRKWGHLQSFALQPALETMW